MPCLKDLERSFEQILTSAWTFRKCLLIVTCMRKKSIKPEPSPPIQGVVLFKWPTIHHFFPHGAPVSVCKWAKGEKTIKRHVDNNFCANWQPQTDHVSPDSLNPDQQMSCLKHVQQQELVNPLHLRFPLEPITAHEQLSTAQDLIRSTALGIPEGAQSNI